MTTTTSDLVVIDDEPSAIVEANPDAVIAAFTNYQAIQSALDRAMPSCIMIIQGKQFRKKEYWRAIATAFNLDLEEVSEKLETLENGDWGYLVRYRATAGNGRRCDGDGACFASEKRAGQDSRHNVRAHAHTRAKNRAIADLVGFGEVSADEINHDQSADPFGDLPAKPKAPRKAKAKAKAVQQTATPPAGGAFVTKLPSAYWQACFNAADEAYGGKTDENKFAASNWALKQCDIPSQREIPARRLDEVIETMSQFPDWVRAQDEDGTEKGDIEELF